MESKELDFDIKLEGGKLKLVAKYDGKGLDSELSLSADAGYFVDKLAAAIPGGVDDKVFAALKVLLLK